MRKNNPLVWLSVFLIKKIWQGNIGNRIKKKRHIVCRFYPSCSEYAILALEKYGFIKGMQKAWGRIKRCAPNNTGECIDYP